MLNMHTQLGMADTNFYTLNGALLILFFLVFRVLFVPITVTIYAAQYHQWDVVQALGRMTRICHLCNAIQFCLQLYWFVCLLQLAARVVGRWFGPTVTVARKEAKGGGVKET